jgi:NDMA-dependent alcohol dehydrogenase
VKTRTAVLFEQPGKFEVVEVDLDDEVGPGEVLVELVATGLCHSDDHGAKGDLPMPVPFVMGHEGGGIVRAVGSGVSTLEVGDHVITIFVPACGRCRWCAMGMQNLCDEGASALNNSRANGKPRMMYGDQPIGTGLGGSFSEWQLFDELALIKVPKDVPLELACILACGVPTGWGSATNAAGIAPGDAVIVMGCGGVGMSAVQGASHKGAGHVVAVDPVEFKRTSALKLGATEAFATIDEATEFVRSVTNGQGADSAIITVGVIQGEHIRDGFAAIRKGGTVVVTSIGSVNTNGIPINLVELAMYQKRIQGALYGMDSPRRSVPQLIDMYRRGQLNLDDMVTNRYRLDQINDAYTDMHDGVNIRGIIAF